MRSVKAKPATVKEDRERPSTGNDAAVVLDDQYYVVVPNVSGEQGEEESGYVHPAAVPRRQNQPNVYDVITPTA
ncbi:hypothetical protein NP493_48g07046 [Ridgeia piscesae]|uniref:Uncharacterized protein n=1 Tax=Ridgeia piscesae TaxID=27915 RepID=A0AAD9UJK3_RIDPI|nr:hypothetical protein NP493_48g07046 [Ridgeia piscesae]